MLYARGIVDQALHRSGIILLDYSTCVCTTSVFHLWNHLDRNVKICIKIQDAQIRSIDELSWSIQQNKNRKQLWN